MIRSWKGRLLIVTTALLVGMLVGAVAPASAGYDKAYRFKLPTAVSPDDVVGVRVVTNAMEILTDQYDGWRAPWEDTEPAYLVLGGTYVTRLNYNDLKEEFDLDPDGVPWCTGLGFLDTEIAYATASYLPLS